MSPKGAARLAWGLFALALAMVAATVVLVVVNRDAATSFDDFQPIEITLGITFSLVGVLIALRKPQHRIGWIFLAIGVLSVLPGLAEQYYKRTLIVPSLCGELVTHVRYEF